MNRTLTLYLGALAALAVLLTLGLSIFAEQAPANYTFNSDRARQEFEANAKTVSNYEQNVDGNSALVVASSGRLLGVNTTFGNFNVSITLRDGGEIIDVLTGPGFYQLRRAMQFDTNLVAHITPVGHGAIIYTEQWP